MPGSKGKACCVTPLNTQMKHVALAIVAGYTNFVTGDGDQAKLAKAAGLSCTLVSVNSDG
jgi:hypothetical protein